MMCPFVLPFDITSNTSNVTFKSLGKLRCDINIPENPAEIVKEKPPQDIQRYKLLHIATLLHPSTRDSMCLLKKVPPHFVVDHPFSSFFPTEHGDVGVIPLSLQLGTNPDGFGKAILPRSRHARLDLSCCSAALVKRRDADRFCVVWVFK